MEKNNFKNQKGVSIYLALLIIAIFLDLSFGLSFILFGEILTMRDIDHSVVAFYAADTGMERIFYIDNVECFEQFCPGYCESTCNRGLKTGYVLPSEELWPAGPSYEASFVTTTDGSRIATSTGVYQKTRRSLRGDY